MAPFFRLPPKASPAKVLLPQVPMFTDGKKPTWEEWHPKICDKLAVDMADCPEHAKIAYVFSRVGGRASTYIYARHPAMRRERLRFSSYATANEIIQELSMAFEDPNRPDTLDEAFRAEFN